MFPNSVHERESEFVEVDTGSEDGVGLEGSAWIGRGGDLSAVATPLWGRFRRERGVGDTD